MWHDTRRWSKCNCWKVWNQVCEWRNTFLFLDEIKSKCSKQTSPMCCTYKSKRAKQAGQSVVRLIPVFWWQCKCSVDIRPTLASRRIGGFPFTSVPPTLACQHIYLRHPLRASRPLPLIHGRRDRKASKKAACRHPKSLSTAQSFTTLSRTVCTIPVRGVNESQHASFLSSPQEKWYLI